MKKQQSLRLFKENITRTHNSELIKELSDAIDGGTIALTKLLFGESAPDLYTNHGTYSPGKHNHCAGLSNERYTEKRLCKCMYYLNCTHSKNCDTCLFRNRFGLIGDYRLTDYEVPAFYYGDGIGEIDLIISDDSTDYAVEIKPYKGNNETLLRMITEIMTCTEGYPTGKYKKAIAFFEKNRDSGEKTPQQKEYEAADTALFALLKKADITIFRFEEAGEKAYRICKL